MDEIQNNGGFQPQQPQGSAGMGVASMVLGIGSILLICFIPYLTIITSIVGIVLAAISMKNNMPGKGMAIAGLVLSIIALVLLVIFVILAAIGLYMLDAYSSYY